MKQIIKLIVQEFQWVFGLDDDLEDQCAHGRVLFRINDTVFVKPEDGIWTVSASGLYLLRTLFDDHTLENSVAEGNFLFPCCAFTVWTIGKRFKVYCMGCPNGIDIEITHQEGMVTIKSKTGAEIIPRSDWIKSVLCFIDSVSEFYRASTPKVIIEDAFDRQGWAAFWQEWDERYQKAKILIDF
jgi:hypothetical protein